MEPWFALEYMADERLEGYMALAQQAYETAFGEAQDLSRWENIKSGTSFVAAKKTMEGGLAALKIDAYISLPSQEVVRRLYGHFAEFSQEFIPDMFEFETILKEFNPTTKLVHSATKQPAPGVSARDAVYFGVLLELEEANFALVETSVDAAEMPPRDDFVRSQIKYALHTFEPLEANRTHMLMIALIDPKGSLPAGIVNMTLGRRADFYEKIVAKIAS